MGAKPSFYLKSIAIWAPAFFIRNNSFIAAEECGRSLFEVESLILGDLVVIFTNVAAGLESAHLYIEFEDSIEDSNTATMLSRMKLQNSESNSRFSPNCKSDVK